MAALKFGDPLSIKIRDGITEESSPIERMRAAFGFKQGKHCGACRHFKLQSYFEVHCTIYQTYEEARGLWHGAWDACGKWRR